MTRRTAPFSGRSVAGPGGWNDLTDIERQTLRSIAEGYSNGEIADRYDITEHAVRARLINLLRKLNVGNRTQAAVWYAMHYREVDPGATNPLPVSTGAAHVAA